MRSIRVRYHRHQFKMGRDVLRLQTSECFNQIQFKTYAPPTPNTVKVVDVTGHETKAIKQAFLASNNFVTGNSSLEHYASANNAAPEVVDLVIGNLPP